MKYASPPTGDKHTQIYDLIGIGFGPANIALAIGLEELWPEADYLFLEQREGPQWQSGMRMRESDIQNHPLRDLVTPRNPRSHYSFTNFLHQKGRLFEHLNLGRTFPFRTEYEQYVQWAANHFKDRTLYGHTARKITCSDSGIYTVITSCGQSFQSRNLVVAPGRSPLVPEVFQKAMGRRCIHLTDYLPTLEREFKKSSPGNIAVVGGSQSAVELLLDLSSRFPKAQIHGFKRSFGFRMKDVGPFTGEVYFPSYVDIFYGASPAQRESLKNDLRLTNYSASDADVLNQLYERIYQQKITNQQTIHIHRRAHIISATHQKERVYLEFSTLEDPTKGELEFDLVILATGFMDLGPAAYQEAIPALLEGLRSRLKLDLEGCVQIQRDYSVLTSHTLPSHPTLFLNGLCENSHGMGDAGSFSLLSLRAQTILEAARASVETSQTPERNSA